MVIIVHLLAAKQRSEEERNYIIKAAEVTHNFIDLNISYMKCVFELGYISN